MTLTHDACRALLIDLAYGELDRRAALRVEDHLAGCPECRTEWERLGATRRTMQALEPVEPDAGGERILLAAARQAADARAATRQARLFPGWVWKLSATTAAVLIVGGVSYRILWPQQALQAPDRASEVYAPAAASSPTVANAPLPAAAPPMPAPSAGAAPRLAAKAAAKRGAQDAARSVAEERLAPHKAKKEMAATAPASMAPPPPPSSPAPVADADPDRFALRMTPEGGAVKRKQPTPDVAEDARKADQAEEEAKDAPLVGVAGAASGLTVSEQAARSRQAPGQTALAERRPNAVPKPASPQEEIDALAQAIDQRGRAGQLARVGTGPCHKLGEVERRFYRDDGGRIVSYQRRELTGDGSVTVEHYYDQDGRLRLARITRIRSGQRTVERIYLDATGERSLSGDRVPTGLVRDPEAASRSATPCGDGP